MGRLSVRKSLQVRLHEAKLPQGHLEVLAGGRGALPLVQLDGHPPARRSVAELVGHARPELSEGAKLFATADFALVLAQALGHAIDGNGQIAEFIIDLADADGREVALGDAPV